MRPNKLKRNLIIIFSIILIISVTIVVLYSVTDVFRTKRGIFFRYLGQIPECMNVLETSKEYNEYINTKRNNSYITNGEMVITESSNIADESILNKIKLTVNGKTDSANEKSNNEISIRSENNELFNMTISKDKNLYGFYSEQIADGYIVARNKELNVLAQNMKLENADNIPEQIMPINIKEILNTSTIEKKHIAKYIKMIRNKAPDTAYSKEENKRISIDGQKYDTTASILKLNSEANENLQIDLLEELSKDSIMMNYITSKCKLMNLTGTCTDINLLNSKMKSHIEKLKNDNTSAGELTFTIYEYKQKNIQTKIQINDMIIKITHLTIEDKEITRLEVEDKNKKSLFEIQKTNEKHIIKLWQEEDNIEKSIEFEYFMTGSVEENNIQNHLTINVVNDIKTVKFEYKDTIDFTNDIGIIKTMSDDKVAVINDYESDYIKEFVDTVKKQINSVYINKAASVGINLEPIFK